MHQYSTYGPVFTKQFILLNLFKPIHKSAETNIY